jgi:hypothetical protein
MIELGKFKDFDDSMDEGKLLLAAMSVLTSIDCCRIKSGEFGGSVSPDKVFRNIVDIANKIYYEEEYKNKKIILKRDKKIHKLLNKY